MKPSAILVLGAFLVGGLIVLFQQKQLMDLREEEQKLEKQVVRRDFSPKESAREPRKGSIFSEAFRSSSKDSKNPKVTQEAALASLLALGKDLEAQEKTEEENAEDEVFQHRAEEVLLRLAELDFSQFQKVIRDLKESGEISGKARGKLVAFSLDILADARPELAVRFFRETSDLLDGSDLGRQAMQSVLETWARRDPEAVADWLAKHGGKLVDDDAKLAALSGMATKSPEEAFKALRGMKVEDLESAMQLIVSSESKDAGKNTEVLTALRGYLAGITDESDRAKLSGIVMEGFAHQASEKGFEALSGWVAQANLTPEEMARFVGGLTWFSTRDDTGRWVEWLGKNVSGEQLANQVHDLMGEWTQRDYQAAGKWLSAQPDGGAKVSAVEAYVEAIAEYEPQVAVQWAMTIPAGEGRASALRTIYENWPKRDAAGAAAFAKQYGLE